MKYHCSCFNKDVRLCVWFLTCDDGGGLTSHLVFVDILSIVQLSLHQDSGPDENYEKIKLLRKSEEDHLFCWSLSELKNVQNKTQSRHFRSVSVFHMLSGELET